MSQSSSNASSGRSRRRRSPPPRLGWPAAAARAFSEEEEDDDDDAGNHSKRPRRVTFGAGTSSSRQQPKKKKKKIVPGAKRLWTETYAPQSSSELAVAPKKVKEVAAWLQDDSGGKMLILVGSPGVGKSTMIHCLAKEQRLAVQEWIESYCGGGMNGAIEHLTPLNSLQQFLQQTATGFASLLSRDNNNHASNSSSSIILLDELPHLHGPDAEARFRDVLTEHVQRTAVKTVLIYSDTVEGKARPDCLEKLIHHNVLYDSHQCKIMQIHPPTKARFGKVVQKIAASERRSLRETPEELHARCNGDLRFAITTLQYEMVGSSSNKAKRATKNGIHHREQHRDTKLSSFHALGKLLYAKRQKVSNENGQERPPLEFDPERVVEQSEMELSGVLHFLGSHSPEFFTDNVELSTAFDHFSDAALLLDHTYGGGPSSVFPTAYARSLAGRAVAHANRHPAAFRFRQFTAPKVFDVLRKRRDNRARLQSAATAHQHRRQCAAADTYAMDVLPFVRTIRPADQPLVGLNSYFDAVSQRQASTTRESDEAEMAAMMKEQEAILQLDDIVDDDDADF